MSKETMDIVGKIMAFEQGELENEEVYALFQFLLDSGMLHSLQGSYQNIVQPGDLVRYSEAGSDYFDYDYSDKARRGEREQIVWKLGVLVKREYNICHVMSANGTMIALRAVLVEKA